METIKTYFGVFLFVICLAVVTLGAFALALLIPPIPIFESATTVYVVRPWILWFIGGAAYIILSFRFSDPVKPDQIGVRTLFGMPTDQVGPGLPFVPLGIFELQRLTNLTVQNEWPTEPENVYRGDEHTTPTNGQKPPIRITFRNSTTEEEARDLLGDYYDLDSIEYEGGKKIDWKFQPHAPDDGLASRVTAEVVAVTKYRIKDGVKYIQTVGSVEQAAKQIEDVVVAVLQRFLPLMSVGQALQNIEWISLILNEAVDKRTEGWGIELEAPKGAYVKAINFHRKLNESIAAPAKADFEAKGTIRASKGEREKRINEGQGAAQAAQDLAKSELAGRGDGLKHMIDTLGVTGNEALAAEVASTFGKAGNTVIVDSKTGIAGLAGLASSLFQNKTPPAPKPATPAADPKKGGTTP